MSAVSKLDQIPQEFKEVAEEFSEKVLLPLQVTL